jgi:hypothetical protein
MVDSGQVVEDCNRRVLRATNGPRVAGMKATNRAAFRTMAKAEPAGVPGELRIAGHGRYSAIAIPVDPDSRVRIASQTSAAISKERSRA